MHTGWLFKVRFFCLACRHSYARGYHWIFGGIISLTNGVGIEGKMSPADRVDVALARAVTDSGAVPTDFRIFVPAPERRNKVRRGSSSAY